MRAKRGKLRCLVRSEAGATLIQYALFVALGAGLVVVSVSLFSTLETRRAPEPPRPEPTPPINQVANYATVDVFYATDRSTLAFTKEAGYYGGGRAEDRKTPLQFGICQVSIPRDHRMGQLESPSLLKLEFREDPEKHVVLLSVATESPDGFIRKVTDRVGRSSKKDAFVFIHGFNVSFEDAARRTAQIAYDLGFEGAPILYSWPSQGKLLEYTVDETNAEWTVPHLRTFLETIAASSGAQSIHLIAHSMGGRVMMAALQQLSPSARRRFSEVVLSAPDIDADIFRRLAAQVHDPSSRMTLYASSKDDAIIASKKVHGYPRAGESGENIVIADGVDTVDATSVETAFIGHFYYADNLSVLSDLYYLFKDHKPPQERFGLKPVRLKLGVYYAFRP
jgi:esterase/lipase superfamily enzyme/Flp pilus assembly pilin Flp